MEVLEILYVSLTLSFQILANSEPN